MAKDRLGSDYSENISEITPSSSCMIGSIDKCSLRGCSGMFQEPFFLHPPGSRPRDGLYINPMNSPFQTSRQKESASHGSSESFYLHSPHDLIYTRITHLFEDGGDRTNVNSRSSTEGKDDTLTVKVDVHINNGTLIPNGSTNSLRSELAKDSGSEHAYEQICIGHEEQGNHKYTGAAKKHPDNASDISSRSRKMDRRYSRSSSASESSNMSSEVHCYSSTTSTPSLSRNSSNERMSKSPKVTEILAGNNCKILERKTSTTSSTRAESEKGTKAVISGSSMFRPPPPPPPPPPEIEEVVIVTSKIAENNIKEQKLNGNQSSTQEQKFNSNITTISAVAARPNDEDDAAAVAQRVPGDSAVGSCTPNASAEEESRCTTSVQPTGTSHPLSRHMVLPFIPPKFANQATDSESLLKPSEYLRSICKGATSGPANSLSKARSVDNLDIQGCGSDDENRKSDGDVQPVRTELSGPPPPPLPPPPNNGIVTLLSTNSTAEREHLVKQSQHQQQQTQQPLATISIQDLTSVQLRRTNVKMNATKTFSAPPNRSVSMTNVSEAFFIQKTDLIAELKKTKDIPGIKKLKVQRAQVEKSEEQNLITEINKAFSISNFVDQIPEKDNSGNVIPIWKRQMLAKKAAERAKKELEEQIARENEEKRQKAIPPWKRQLLAKKDSEIKIVGANPVQSVASVTIPLAKVESPLISKKDISVDNPPTSSNILLISAMPSKSSEENKSAIIQEDEKRNGTNDDSEFVHIIPWRAQLRKTNSKLNILD
ncbi:PREDICTED: uncharacterized protein LOC105363556 [Ceratosolen solmsi marchali]|uniref:Uncharacterized protein LOC105363556 n=1 Tax=Ceratosolen solmsi marchali TaxID=326594 RepID=A0AAJ7DX30_9HYME|nr:PREDICTED: uncharacterized protein LOC105363556 [Ceratosolen solmsi marchali]